MLITKYLAAVDAQIVPFSRKTSKSTKLFLSLLMKESAKQANNTKITTKLHDLRTPTSTLKVTYKDGKVVEVDAGQLRISDLVNQINAHSKSLALKDQVS
ncbi:protein of unknown function [Taphrina deformans PYCC 5710]|uniref:Large ribosomal subunit protein mL53 n=1 Tax=Taphrina deformans (strain PYCC 5710 / ATCC 11124 / CBS 356.35 / IMI 108563 / JCM 9778 / NBRC 8474) TaxID=1097556 RepID=R4XIP6_TAPDE|nr:protein of unknown function [Taphrina deformans PYCC 5710]|eukprot:CCG83243.1 protein of unknown function [Taphrina deformans PYCC 5710]